MLGLLVRQLQFFTPFLKFHRQLAHFFSKKIPNQRRYAPIYAWDQCSRWWKNTASSEKITELRRSGKCFITQTIQINSFVSTTCSLFSSTGTAVQNFACSLDEILQKGYYLVSSSYSNFCVRDSATTTSVLNVLLKLQCHSRIIQYCVIHFRLPLEIQKNCIALDEILLPAVGDAYYLS